MTLGHLIVLPVGHMVFGIDPVNQKVLWERNLHTPIAALSGRVDVPSTPGYNQLIPDPRDGSILVIYPEGWQQRLGQTGPLEGSSICLQAREGLMAVDPLTGRILWVRTDIGSRSKIFGDGENVYIVEMNEANAPSRTLALRASDGVLVKSIPDFTTPYARPNTRLIGCTLLVQEPVPTGGLNVRHYDVATGKDLWSETFPAGSVVTKTEDPNLVSVLTASDGKLRVFDLRTRKEVLSVTLRPTDLLNMHSATVLADGTYFFVAINGPFDQQGGAAQSGLLANTGMQSVPVNGQLYCFVAATGKMKWYNPTENQMIVLDYFRELPIILMTSRYNKRVAGPGSQFVNVVAVKSIDKLTGKRVYDKNSDNTDAANGGMALPQQNFHALIVDVRAGKVELISSQAKITHQLASEGEVSLQPRPKHAPPVGFSLESEEYSPGWSVLAQPGERGQANTP